MPDRNADMSQPWWVLVHPPGREHPKFYSGYATEADAQQVADEEHARAGERVTSGEIRERDRPQYLVAEQAAGQQLLRPTRPTPNQPEVDRG